MTHFMEHNRYEKSLVGYTIEIINVEFHHADNRMIRKASYVAGPSPAQYGLRAIYISDADIDPHVVDDVTDRLLSCYTFVCCCRIIHKGEVINIVFNDALPLFG